MYLNKFSSGTILALLALSGILFLVPAAVPAQAVQNASLPTISLSNNLVVNQLGNGETITIANPSTNAYGITAFTVTAPTGWNFSTIGAAGVACPSGFALTPSLTAISCQGGTTGIILPGFSAAITITGNGVHGASGTGIQGPSVAATANPVPGVFQTSITDGGSAGFYVGPTFTLWSIATPSGTIIAETSSSTSFVAGSAPITLTATLGNAEPGVPVTWSATAGSTAAGTFSASTTTTSSTGVATVTYTPSNTAGTATVTATLADKPSGSPFSSLTETTVPATPSLVSFTFTSTGGAVPSTHYITTSVSGPLYANEPANYFTYAVSDQFSNSIPSGDLSTLVGHFTATNGWWDGSLTMVTTNSYNAPNGHLADQYSQSATYATVGLITGTFTGFYTPPGGSTTPFSVSGSTGQLFTSTLGTVASENGFIITTNGVTPTATGGAGSFVIPQLTLSVPQPGVPVTLNLCVHSSCSGTTSGYTGTFASNGLTSIIVDTSATSPSSGNASAHFNVDTTLGHAAIFNATVAAPIDGTPTNHLTAGPSSPAVVTVAGTAAKLGVFIGLATGPLGITTHAVPGATVYLDVYAADKYGNLSPNALGQQVQINLVASTGALSVNSAYIPNNCWTTNGTSDNGCNFGYSGFGSLSWTLPNTVGTVASLTVSGVIAGAQTSTTVTVTTVSPLPTLSVTAPKPVNNVIYSQSAAVIFQGQANSSIGYLHNCATCDPPVTTGVTISTLAYKVNTNKWEPVTIATGSSAITWSLAATMPQGLSTIWFNTTDSKGNVVVSPAYTVLVDNQPPTFTIGVPASGSGSDTVTIKTAEGDFNTSTFVATYGSTTVPSSSISWSGTQTVGSPSTLTATINGLTTGTNTLTVSGSTYTGVAGSASSSITITIVFADSVTFTTASAAWGSSGAAQGIFVPVTNSWSSSQQLTLYATLKSGTSTYVLVGGETLAAGQTGTVFVQDFLAVVPAGTYTVTFSAITTANQAVSAPTTPITVVVP